MADFSRNLLSSFALSALCVALASCGAGSNNLADPTDNTDTTSTCGSSAGLCVTGQLIDEPVAGVNYECDSVVNVTTAEGYFVCPNNSVVTFYILSSDGKRKVTLGSSYIKPLLISVADPATGKSKTDAQLFQVTPLSLVDKGDELDSLDGADVGTVRAVNIMRLLQGISEPTFAAPAGRLVISQAARDKLNLLKEDIGAGTFGGTDVIDSLISEIGITLPGKDAAKARFLASQKAVASGLYSAPAQVFSVMRAEDDIVETGMVGQSGSTRYEKNGDGVITRRIADKAVESILLLLDRDGKSISLGLEWLATVDSGAVSDTSIPKSISEIRLKTAPSDLEPVTDSLGFTLSGKIKPNFKFRVIDKNSGLPNGIVEVTQGKLRQGFISSHPFVYRSLFGLGDSADVPLDELGKWRRYDALNNLTYSGTVNLERRRRFDPLLDPAGWKTLETVNVGEKPVFPLHLRLTFKDSDVSAVGGCPVTNGCNIGSVGMTVLENGNIISDVDNNCGAVDANLTDTSSATQEYRLGSVSAVFPLSGKYYISPVLLFTRIPGWEAFYGIMIGDSGRKVRIDISGIHDRLISIKSFEPDKADISKLSEGPGEWLNYPQSLKYSQAYPASADKTASLPKTYGTISAVALQSCYNPAPKPAAP